MMRRAVKLLLVLAILIVAAVLAITVYVNRTARQAIEHQTAESAGVPARLDRARVGIMTGNFDLGALRLSNPDGFESPMLMVLQHGEGSVRLGSYFEDVVELRRLELRDIELHLERRERGNYEPVLESIRRAQQATPDPGRRQYVIREVLVRNLTVHIDVLPIPDERARLSVHIDELRFEGVGTEMDRGLVLSEVTGVLLQALLTAVLERAGEELPRILSDELAQRLRGLRDLEDFGIRAPGESIERIDEIIRGIPGVRDVLPPRPARD
jgi:hypothetical protein